MGLTEKDWNFMRRKTKFRKSLLLHAINISVTVSVIHLD